MNYLGIDCITGTCSLVSDKKLLSSMSESILSDNTFTSETSGLIFPEKAIEFCLNNSGLSIEKIDGISFSGKPFTQFGNILKKLSENKIKNFFKIINTASSWVSHGLWPEKKFKKTAFKNTFSYIPKPLCLAGFIENNSSFFYTGTPTTGFAVALGYKKNDASSLIEALDWPSSIESIIYAVTDLHSIELNKNQSGLNDSGKTSCHILQLLTKLITFSKEQTEKEIPTDLKDKNEDADKLVKKLFGLDKQEPNDPGFFRANSSCFILENSHLICTPAIRKEIELIGLPNVLIAVTKNILKIISNALDKRSVSEFTKQSIICSPFTKFLFQTFCAKESCNYKIYGLIDTPAETMGAAFAGQQSFPDTLTDIKSMFFPKSEDIRLICEKRGIPYKILDNKTIHELCSNYKSAILISAPPMDSAFLCTGIQLSENNSSAEFECTSKSTITNNKAYSLSSKEADLILNNSGCQDILHVSGLNSKVNKLFIKPFINGFSPFPEMQINSFINDSDAKIFVFNNIVIQKKDLTGDLATNISMASEKG